MIAGIIPGWRMKTRNSRKPRAVLALAISTLLAMAGSIGAGSEPDRQPHGAGAVSAHATTEHPQTQPPAKPGVQPANTAAAPPPSPVLTAQDKELLAEALRLKQALGDEVWPGLGGASIPVIVYNEGYEFLTGPVNPAPAPPWAKVEKDTFAGEPYFRRPAEHPQAFAVNLGEQWAASMTSLETMNRKARIKISRDFYVVFLLHEAFHAFQALMEPARFREANSLYVLEKSYPAKEPVFAKAWTEEGAILAAALKAKDRDETMDRVRAFLRQRDSRRGALPFNVVTAEYERQMEWLEGLAKYAEIRFYELAATRSKEPAFAAYRPGLAYWTWDFVRLEKQLGAQEGDLRFYLSGMAQARLLDRLAPDWKIRFFKDGGGTEDRLRRLAQSPPSASPKSSER